MMPEELQSVLERDTTASLRSYLEPVSVQSFPMLELPQVPAAAAEVTHRLQIVNTSVLAVGMSPAVAKFRIRLGWIAGAKADAGMADPGDTPIFEMTVVGGAGWYVIYTQHDMTYIGNGQWTADPGVATIGVVDTPRPATDDANYYVEIGQVRVSADGVIDAKIQTAKGDWWIYREGSSTIYNQGDGMVAP